ncbi:DUF3472 domain-containing protein [Roseibacillus ishigakijimensis]|uniref:DUF3472 domain-containing protein n=1 Tax=Roseibacillus ishigakijimensis TaxID=454146 RepID=UPI0019071E63|nr:DUF3472 domain-containing protein [Roseibacillus ishigakijimensis]
MTAQHSREERHAHIKATAEKFAHLEHPHFAPSVHIGYQHPEREARYLAYYNEIQVEETFVHTYFCTIGFQGGYLGIQDTNRGKIAIFSLWDKGGGAHNQADVAEEDRTQILYSNPAAKSSRFGGEGSGAKTMMPFEWELGKTYQCLVALTPQEKGTIYTAWIRPAEGEWLKIASYQAVMTVKDLRGFYSFVEDFVRNGETGQHRRRALYPRQGALTTGGEWLVITEGRGTIADDLLQNGHSGVSENVFYSQSGADTADYASQPRAFRVEREGKTLALELPGDFPSGRE